MLNSELQSWPRETQPLVLSEKVQLVLSEKPFAHHHLRQGHDILSDCILWTKNEERYSEHRGLGW